VLANWLFVSFLQASLLFYICYKSHLSFCCSVVVHVITVVNLLSQVELNAALLEYIS